MKIKVTIVDKLLDVGGILYVHPKANFINADICDTSLFQITNEHMLDVASKVHFTITFWTSGAIDCYLLGVPVIEYYDPNKFPRGQVLENKIFTSIYRKLKIVSPANNEKELIKALKDLIKRNYKLHSNKPHSFYNKLLVRSNNWEKKIENILLSHNFINKKY